MGFSIKLANRFYFFMYGILINHKATQETTKTQKLYEEQYDKMFLVYSNIYFPINFNGI